ncbi:MAG TPA: hypothetical protein VGC79_08070 [Polyangiaceae bacterium]
MLKLAKSRYSTLTIALLLLSGCGADDSPKADRNGASGASYAVCTGVLVGENFISYLTTVPSLEAGSRFNLDHALEIDPSWIFGQQGRPSVYVASMLVPTIDRYDLNADGSLTKGDTVSFANYGLQSAYLAAAAPIYSDDKSYFIDDLQDQVVIWNPRLMRTIGTIPLGNRNEGKLPPAAEGTIVMHDGLILTVTHWSDPNEDPSVYGSHVRLVAIDPKTDQIVRSTDDARLTYAVPQGRASDGSIYYSPNSFISSETEVGPGHGSPSHLLRVAPNAAEFDAEYELDLSALVGGRPAGDFTLLDDQTALIRAWHPELVDPVTPETWKDVLWTEAGFLWWRWRVGDAEAVQVPNQNPGALGTAVFSLDGKTYVVRTSSDSTSTSLDEVDVAGEFQPALTGPGQLMGNGIVRLR